MLGGACEGEGCEEREEREEDTVDREIHVEALSLAIVISISANDSC